MATVIELPCVICGKLIPAHMSKRSALYCDPVCRFRGRGLVQKDFWKYVFTTSPDECWPWLGAIDTNGYGYFEESINGKRTCVVAHRKAFELKFGRVPKGEGYHGTVIRHTCDVSWCCNPNHLITGTQADNGRDMASRGRVVSKITEADVIAIRDDSRPYLEISAQYGVAVSSVCDIKKRRTWKHM